MKNLRLKKDIPFFRKGIVKTEVFWKNLFDAGTYNRLSAIRYNGEFDEWFEEVKENED